LTDLTQLHTLHRVPTSNEVPTFPLYEDSPLASREGIQRNQSPPPVDANNPVWGVGGALLLWIATILVQAIIPLLFIIPFALHRGLDPGSPDFTKAAIELAVTDPTAILLQIIAILPTHLLTLALLWAFVTRLGKRPFLASFGWGWSSNLGILEGAALVVIGGVLFIAGTVLASFLSHDTPTQLEQLINSSVAARYTIAALAVFTAPFVEEFMYRGVLYSALQRTIGVKLAVVFVLALFTVIHVPQYWPNVGVISAVALLSIVLTIVRAYSGRLLPCVIIHMSFNAVQALILVLQSFVQRLSPAPPAVPSLSMLWPLLWLLLRLFF
jgi:membrane protease YdiL (CAAX protease family)